MKGQCEFPARGGEVCRNERAAFVNALGGGAYGRFAVRLLLSVDATSVLAEEMRRFDGSRVSSTLVTEDVIYFGGCR